MIQNGVRAVNVLQGLSISGQHATANSKLCSAAAREQCAENSHAVLGAFA